MEQHACTYHITVTMQQQENMLILSIEDDGYGFEIPTLLPNTRFGLRGMRERTEFIGGCVHIETAPGKGTAITLTIERMRDTGCRT